MSQATTPRKPAKPRTARQHNAEQGVLDVRIVGYEIPEGDGGSGNSSAGGPPQPPALPRRRGGGRKPLPPWQRALLFFVFLLFAAIVGSLIGRACIATERALERVGGFGPPEAS